MHKITITDTNSDICNVFTGETLAQVIADILTAFAENDGNNLPEVLYALHEIARQDEEGKTAFETKAFDMMDEYRFYWQVLKDTDNDLIRESLADKFVASYPTGISDLMTALDDAGIPCDQDWQDGRTAWVFEDGSKVIVEGFDVMTTSAVTNLD